MTVRTGKGDTGYTDLFFDKHISKDAVPMKAMGDIDELVSYLGLVKVKIRPKWRKVVIEKVQCDICAIASELALITKKKKGYVPLLEKENVEWIKDLLRRIENTASIKDRFYMPSDSELGAYLDIARAVARRAERSTVEVFRGERGKRQGILTYLNCISDLLFVIAKTKKPPETYMIGRKKKTGRKPVRTRKSNE